MSKATCSVDGCETPAFCRGWCHRHYDRWRVTGAPEDRAPSPCRTCGEPVTLPRSGPMPTYCSEPCRPKPPVRTWSGFCVVCGVETDGFRTYRRYCSRACQVESCAWPDGRPKGTDCVKCGERIDFSLVRPGGRKLRADTKKCLTCRRDYVMSTTVHDLVGRDGTDCSLCGNPVDMTLKWPDLMAPTRDHIIPWSLGGSNAADNLALAHFVCNIKKQNKTA